MTDEERTTSRRGPLIALRDAVEAGTFDAPPTGARAPYFNKFMDMAEPALPQTVTGCNALAWRAYNQGSLDAAKALHEAVLPRHYAQVHIWPEPEMSRVDIGGGHTRRSNNPARAWLLNIIDALITKEPQP